MCNILLPVFTAMALTLTAGGNDKNPTLNTEVSGKVEDLFENNQVLISIGKVQGAQKGQRIGVYRLKPQRSDSVYLAFLTGIFDKERPLYIGYLELLEVGAHLSLCKFQGRIAIHEGDHVSSRAPEGNQFIFVDAYVKDGFQRKLQRLSFELESLRWEMMRRGIRHYEPGGAIIDLTLPKNPR